MTPRRGFLFTADALFAGMVIIGGLLVLSVMYKYDSDTTQLSSTVYDSLQSVDTIRLVDMKSQWVQDRISDPNSSNITDANITALEQIGRYWSMGDTDSARTLSEILLNGTSGQYRLRLSINNTVVYGQENWTADDIMSSSRMVTGIAKGEATTGYAASAYLKRLQNKTNVQVMPFGGFIGQGNITVQLGPIPSDVSTSNITGLMVQIDTVDDFNLSINGAFCQRLTSDRALMAVQAWDLSACKGSLVPGYNNFTFASDGNVADAYIAGGFVKIHYMTTKFQELVENTTSIRYRFPKIDGIINIYDALSIPGAASDWYLNVSFYSNYTVFMRIGNDTVFSRSGSNGTQTIELEAHNLGWNATTMPLRLGTTNFTNVTFISSGLPADTALITDVSGSMGDWVLDTCNYRCNRWQYNCSYQCNKLQFNCSYQCNQLNCTYDCTKNKNPTVKKSCSTSGACAAEQCGACAAGYNDQNYAVVTLNTVPKSCSTNGTCSGSVCGSCAVNYTAQNYVGANITVNSSTLACFTGGTCSGSVCGSCAVNYTAQNYTGRNITTDYANMSCIIDTGSSCSGTTVCGSCAVNYTAQNYSTRHNQTKLDIAKSADKTALGVMLGVAGNRGGLVSYNSQVSQTMNPTSDIASLTTQVNSYTPTTNTCICCGINRAKDMLANSTNKRFMILMSDGEANYYCSDFFDYTGTSDNSPYTLSKNGAINAGQNACHNYNITVYSIGFGASADKATLKAVACNDSLYFDAANVSQLDAIYQNISSQILLVANFTAQTLVINGTYVTSHLYAGSYLDVNYTPSVHNPEQNEILVKFETPQFANCTTTLDVPPWLRLADVGVTSYSGPYWTTALNVNGVSVFDLTRYSTDLVTVGDPFLIDIPPGYLNLPTNTITLSVPNTTANLSGNVTPPTACSPNDTVFYTGYINNSIPRTAVLSKAEGCNWSLEFEDGHNLSVTIPAGYVGNRTCTYTYALHNESGFDAQDAYDYAVFKLMQQLDIDGNGKIFININDEDLAILVTTISRVPYLWGPTLVRLEVLR